MNYKIGDSPVIEQCNSVDRDDLVICTTHFNPCKFIKSKNTFYEWCKWLGPNINYLKTYELVYDDEKPEILGSEVVYGTSDKHIMFQKEALINKCLNEVSDKIKYFVWMDHDIIIEDKDWIEKSIEKIKNNVKCVQLFKEIYYLGPDQKIIFSDYGRVAYFSHGAPGGAWIASIDFLKEIGGLADKTIVGGGDECFVTSVLPGSNVFKYDNKKLIEHNTKYILNIRSKGYVCSFLDSESFHIYHGTIVNRKYGIRGEILKKQDYNPYEDVLINSDGILEWSSYKPELHKLVKEYFRNRKEDE